MAMFPRVQWRTINARKDVLYRKDWSCANLFRKGHGLHANPLERCYSQITRGDLIPEKCHSKSWRCLLTRKHDNCISIINREMTYAQLNVLIDVVRWPLAYFSCDWTVITLFFTSWWRGKYDNWRTFDASLVEIRGRLASIKTLAALVICKSLRNTSLMILRMKYSKISLKKKYLSSPQQYAWPVRWSLDFIKALLWEKNLLSIIWLVQLYEARETSMKSYACVCVSVWRSSSSSLAFLDTLTIDRHEERRGWLISRSIRRWT